ncbi:L-asparaginase / beta-aspartyl-peptidase [Nematocida sp. AWRm77]|nr:L-asparaginase / beta-aspartyl-peptidase [Nematocida sp. AWRm77]
MQGVVVHLGAGRCSEGHGERLKEYLKGILSKEEVSVEKLIEEIETSGKCNAGEGSYTTTQNTVENEACAMTSSGSFSGVSIIPKGVLPSQIALKYLKQKVASGYVKPLAVVYKDAQYKEEKKEIEHSLSTADTSSPSSALSQQEHISFGDTVGGIGFAEDGCLCISSSGGTKHKVPGRIGPCSIYGANTFSNEKVSVCISGTGESLIRSLICRQIASRVEKEEFEEIHKDLEKFILSEADFPSLGGIAILRKPKDILLVHFQTAPSFIYGYKTSPTDFQAIFHAQKERTVTVHVQSLYNK